MYINWKCNLRPYCSNKIKSIIWFALYEFLDLYSLVVVRNAPKLSAFNFIERKWALVTRRLACVMLDVGIDGGKIPPSKIPGLSAEEKREKDIQVFSAAMNKVKHIVSPSISETHATTVRIIEPESEESPIHALNASKSL